MGAHWREIGAHLRVVPADTTAEDAAKLAKAIADSPRAMTLSEIREMARKMLKRRRGDAIYSKISKQWEAFGLKVIGGGAQPAQRLVWGLDR